MRRKREIPYIPHRGDIRVIKKFAFLPIEIGLEKRWLETVYIKQTWCGGYIDPWSNEDFVSKDEWYKYINSPFGKFMREKGW